MLPLKPYLIFKILFAPLIVQTEIFYNKLYAFPLWPENNAARSDGNTIFTTNPTNQILNIPNFRAVTITTIQDLISLTRAPMRNDNFYYFKPTSMNNQTPSSKWPNIYGNVGGIEEIPEPRQSANVSTVIRRRRCRKRIILNSESVISDELLPIKGDIASRLAKVRYNVRPMSDKLMFFAENGTLDQLIGGNVPGFLSQTMIVMNETRSPGFFKFTTSVANLTKLTTSAKSFWQMLDEPMIDTDLTTASIVRTNRKFPGVVILLDPLDCQSADDGFPIPIGDEAKNLGAQGNKVLEKVDYDNNFRLWTTPDKKILPDVKSTIYSLAPQAPSTGNFALPTIPTIIPTKFATLTAPTSRTLGFTSTPGYFLKTKIEFGNMNYTFPTKFTTNLPWPNFNLPIMTKKSIPLNTTIISIIPNVLNSNLTRGMPFVRDMNVTNFSATSGPSLRFLQYRYTTLINSSTTAAYFNTIRPTKKNTSDNFLINNLTLTTLRINNFLKSTSNQTTPIVPLKSFSAYPPLFSPTQSAKTSTTNLLLKSLPNNLNTIFANKTGFPNLKAMATIPITNKFVQPIVLNFTSTPKYSPTNNLTTGKSGNLTWSTKVLNDEMNRIFHAIEDLNSIRLKFEATHVLKLQDANK